MKKLREIHLYLGCIFAPVLIFFAVSGAWQLFGLHRGRKDHSYTPPKAIIVVSEVHQFQHITPTNPEAEAPVRYFMLAAAVGLVVTTILGIVMAFRFGRSRASVSICLIAGVAIPIALLLLYH